MTRSAGPLLGLVALAAVVQGCPVAWTSKYFGEPPKETEETLVWRRQVEVKEADGRTRRLGYVHKFQVRPAGYRPGRFPELPETTEMYRVFDDSTELVGRIDWEGDSYRYEKNFGRYSERYLGKHDFLNGLRVIFDLSAESNLYLADVDPYRGG
jgi:hypothetical protein